MNLKFWDKRDDVNYQQLYHEEVEKSNILLANMVEKGRSSSDTTRTKPLHVPASITHQLGGEGFMVPVFPFSRQLLYLYADKVDALRIPIDVINRETFINGFEVIPEFAFECEQCGYRYVEKPMETEDENETKCTICGNTKLKMPDPAQRKAAMEIMEMPWNKNNQDIYDVLSQVERDLDVADDAYLLKSMSYDITKDGKIVSAYIEGYEAISPIKGLLLMDNEGEIGRTTDGKYSFVCPRHRSKLIKLVEKDAEKDVHCKECNCQCIPAALMLSPQETLSGESPDIKYVGIDEVYLSHGKYKSTKDYGFSPIYTAIIKIQALEYMDEYYRAYFDWQRPPKSMILIGTNNQAGAEKAMRAMRERLRKDPYDMPVFIVPTETGQRNLVQHLNMTGSLEDLQLTEVRNEFRRVIGTLYGVTPLFCFTSDHDVMTRRGWVNILKLRADDLVATLNLQTKEVEYEIPKSINHWQYDNDIYETYSRISSLAVTPEHKILRYTKKGGYELTQVKDIEGPYVSYLKFNHVGNDDIKGAFILDKYVDISTYVQIVALVLSVGNYARGGLWFRALIDLESTLEKLLKLGIISRYKINGKRWIVDGIITEWARDILNEIPPIFRDLTPNKLKMFFSEFVRFGNMNLNLNNSISLDGNTNFCDTIQEMAIKAGYGSGVWNDKAGMGKVKIRFSEIVKSEVSEFTKKHYKGLVGCVSTENGIIFVRRYGVASWTGNSGDLPNGWNQEGLEQMVTNRAMYRNQRYIEKTYLVPICRDRGITDWRIRLKGVEQTDDLRSEQFRSKQIENAQRMAELGFAYHTDGDGNFVFSQYPVRLPAIEDSGENPGEGYGSRIESAIPEEDTGILQGQSRPKRPSDEGGRGQGAPGSGENTSLSEKAVRKKRKSTKQ